METPEQQKARYEFYKSILKDGDVLGVFIIALFMILGFVLCLVVILAGSGAFAAGAQDIPR